MLASLQEEALKKLVLHLALCRKNRQGVKQQSKEVCHIYKALLGFFCCRFTVTLTIRERVPQLVL